MKRVLIVHAHPEPRSFTSAMKDEAVREFEAAGCEVRVSDLYAKRFNPVASADDFTARAQADYLVYALEQRHAYAQESLAPDVAEEVANVIWADTVVLNFPIFWFSVPAIMKGWIDRVFRLDTAYGYPQGVTPDGVPRGLLVARHAFVFNTSNTPAERERLLFGDPLDVLWKRCVFGLCGVDAVTRRMVGPVSGSTAEQRSEWIGEMLQAISGAI